MVHGKCIDEVLLLLTDIDEEKSKVYCDDELPSHDYGEFSKHESVRVKPCFMLTLKKSVHWRGN